MLVWECHLAQHALDGGVLPRLKRLFLHSYDTFVKEACWAISNITAGTRTQIEAVLESGTFTSVLDVLRSQCADRLARVGEEKIISEAMSAIANAITDGPQLKCCASAALGQVI